MERLIDKTTINKYPSYKDSGIEWSGLVPENWRALPIRAIFEERNEKNDGRKTDYILSVTKDRGVIPYDEKGAIGNNKSEDIERYKLVYPNDFVINKMNVVIGSLGMSKYFGAFSQVYLVYKPKTNQININYYSYIFSNPSFYKSLIKYCTGIMELRESLNKEDFKKLILPFPDFQTQTAIVEYLDNKTALIDQAIGIKQKQIELLKERRQILIHKAVTRGLNPNVKLKDSGVKWIGEIPVGWEVAKLRNVAQTTSGGTPPSGNVKDYYNGEIPWVRTTDLNNAELFDVPEKITDKAIRDTACKLVPMNTICIAMYGGAGTIGKHSILRFEGTLNQALCGVIHGVRLNSEYLYYYIKFYRPHWMIVAKGSRVDPNISQDEVRRMPITLPSIKEQMSIVEYIETSSIKIANAISLKEQEIEKLKEYKATLINSAVTGKIKVC
jgi:type I restriction enzyme S subunit